MKKILSGEVIGKRTLVTTESRPVQVPDAKDLVHLQFRRFAGCPFCSVHLHSFVRRYDEITAAGIREVVVFRSTTASITAPSRQMCRSPLSPTPEDKLYAEFGVGSGLTRAAESACIADGVAQCHPHASTGLPGIPLVGKGRAGAPRRFSDRTDGRVLACKYGSHADDQWSVDELLALARGHQTS